VLTKGTGRARDQGGEGLCAKRPRARGWLDLGVADSARDKSSQHSPQGQASTRHKVKPALATRSSQHSPQGQARVRIAPATMPCPVQRGAPAPGWAAAAVDRGRAGLGAGPADRYSAAAPLPRLAGPAELIRVVCRSAAGPVLLDSGPRQAGPARLGQITEPAAGQCRQAHARVGARKGAAGRSSAGGGGGAGGGSVAGGEAGGEAGDEMDPQLDRAGDRAGDEAGGEGPGNCASSSAASRSISARPASVRP
jgi:hypothetical protein